MIFFSFREWYREVTIGKVNNVWTEGKTDVVLQGKGRVIAHCRYGTVKSPFS